MDGAAQRLQTEVQHKANRVWKNTGKHLMLLQKTSGAAALVLPPFREVPEGSKGARGVISHRERY